MVDVEKLNQGIAELEGGIKNLRNISIILESMSSFNEKAEENSIKTAATLEQITQSRDVILKAVDSSMEATSQLQLATDKIGKLEDVLISEIKSFQSDNLKNYREFQNTISAEIQVVKSESIKAYKEFEGLMTSKLDRAKSDITVENRVNFDKLFENVKENLNGRFKSSYIFNIAIIAIGITLIILHFIK